MQSYRNQAFTILAAVAAIAMHPGARAEAGTILLTAPLSNHPAGEVSGTDTALDNRDYGLRLDTSRVNTFSFDNVLMEFYEPDGAVTPDTVFASITGSVAHLQSSDGNTIGYAAESGLDALDQRWSLTADFRLIDAEGPLFPIGSVPAPDMLQRLIDGGVGDNLILFETVRLSIAPEFDDAAVYDGPREFAELVDDGLAPFVLQFRNLLDPIVFEDPQWDVITGSGSVTPAGAGEMDFATRSLTFVIPEPGSLGMLGVAGMLLATRRRRHRSLFALRWHISA